MKPPDFPQPCALLIPFCYLHCATSGPRFVFVVRFTRLQIIANADDVTTAFITSVLLLDDSSFDARGRSGWMSVGRLQSMAVDAIGASLRSLQYEYGSQVAILTARIVCIPDPNDEVTSCRPRASSPYDSIRTTLHSTREPGQGSRHQPSSLPTATLWSNQWR